MPAALSPPLAQAYKPSLAAINGLAMCLCLGRQHIPVQRQRIETGGGSGAHRQHTHAMPTGELGARWRRRTSPSFYRGSGDLISR